MNKRELLDIMGTENLDAYVPMWLLTPLTVTVIRNPWSTRKAIGGGKSFDIVYYFTSYNYSKLTGTGCIVDSTPIVLENDKVIGYGWTFLEELIGKYKLDIPEAKLALERIKGERP